MQLPWVDGGRVPRSKFLTGVSPQELWFSKTIFWIHTQFFCLPIFLKWCDRSQRRNLDLGIDGFDAPKSVPLFKTSWRRPWQLLHTLFKHICSLQLVHRPKGVLLVYENFVSLRYRLLERFKKLFEMSPWRNIGCQHCYFEFQRLFTRLCLVGKSITKQRG